MIITVLIAGTLAVQGGQVVVQGGPPPAPVPKNAPTALPDTPQAKRVRTYIEAFNTGDDAVYLNMQEEIMSPGTLAKRPATERAKMFARMRGDFGTLRITRVAATPQRIRAVIPDRDGNEAIFSFDFEANAPYRVTGIGVDIGHVER